MTFNGRCENLWEFRSNDRLEDVRIYICEKGNEKHGKADLKIL